MRQMRLFYYMFHSMFFFLFHFLLLFKNTKLDKAADN